MTAFTRPTAHRVYGPTFRTRLDLMGVRFMADDNDDGAGELTAEELAALGDPGKQAIDRMKGKVSSTKAELKAFAELGLTPAQIKALVDKEAAAGKGNAPAAGVVAEIDTADIEKRIRESIETETRTRDEGRARSAEVRAQAAELQFIKPLEALALVPAAKLAAVKVDPATGDADPAAVKALLEDLAKTSPHLIKPKDNTPGHLAAGIGGTGSGAKPDVQPGTNRMESAYANNAKK